MRLFKTIAGLRTCLAIATTTKSGTAGEPKTLPSTFSSPLKIGLVPTMGALHTGHLSLIHRARQENDLVVVSIFVNPLQFGPHEDYQRYPRTLETDCALCEAAGVDIVFAPAATELYPPTPASPPLLRSLAPSPSDFSPTGPLPSGHSSSTPALSPSSHLPSGHSSSLQPSQILPPPTLTAVLCAPFRPGHFEGVATVVTKLFNIVQPQRAYFGQKDAQQCAVIQQVVVDLNLPVEVVPCPTVRELDGLALSSRNRYLSEAERAQAVALYRGLQNADRLFHQGVTDRPVLIQAVKAELENSSAIALEYIDLVHPMTMQPLEFVEDTGLLAIAAHIGTTRLIDNIVLQNRKPIVAIDGPAGAGKSTVVRLAAQELGLLYLDTGAMYRAVTWLVLQSGIAVEDEAAIAELVSECEIRLEDSEQGDRKPGSQGVKGSRSQAVRQSGSQAAGQSSNQAESFSPPRLLAPSPVGLRVWINGQEVTQVIRTPEVTANVSAISAQAAVRRVLVQQQQAYGQRGGVMMDGRDIGTQVFPDAELKIFLTASVQERARRRQQDLIRQGQKSPSLEELEEQIYQRDLKDSTRAISPLRKAADAIELQTDDLTVEEVTAKIVGLYRERFDPSLVS